jgi:hypothetical protein
MARLLYYQRKTGTELKNQYLRSRYLIDFSSHVQSSLFPHLGQLQRHIRSEVSHALHFVYSAKSSRI